MAKKAVIDLSLKLNKPILSLTTNDYNEHGLNDLITEKGEAYEVNLQVFYLLRDSITGWPGGKPSHYRDTHPERALPYPKTCLIFSPHPDDDIISMGGTFIRLQNQGHNVHVAYQTSGNIAVTDEFVVRFLDFTHEFEKRFQIADGKTRSILDDAIGFLENKKTSEKDTDEIRSIKGLIRRSEARAQQNM